MKRYFSILSIISLCLGLAVATPAQNQPSSTTTLQVSVPRLVKFSGTAKDQTGHPKSGLVGITFALYKDQQGGAALWLETQSVQADSSGHYTVLLGSAKAEGLPTEIFSSNDARWLGVQVEGLPEQPRTLLVSAPYALKAADAETLGGKPLSAFQLATPQSTSNSSQQQPLPPEQANEIVCAGKANCKSGFLPVFSSNGGSAKVDDSIISQSGKTVAIGGNESVTGNVGIGSAPGSFQVQVTAPNQLGTAIQGPFTGVGAGLQLQTTGSGGKGWEILNTGKTSAQGPSKLNIRDLSGPTDVFTIIPGGFVGIDNTNPIAGLDVRWNNSFGTAILAKIGTSNSDAGAVTGITSGNIDGAAGLVGAATDNGGGVTYGVFGSNAATDQFAAAVFGDSNATSGPTRGTVGEADSPTGTGVWGFAVAPSVTGSGIGCCAVGVWGDTSSSAGGAAGLVGTSDGGQALFLGNNSTTALTANINNFEASQNNVAILSVNGVGFNQFCNINVIGVLFCSGGHALVVPVDDGQRHVALHAVESPQNWFEDFGSGRLESGVGRIALEPTFAQTVNAGSDYHVFLTPEGECRGLYVTNKSPNGFEVHELGGGRSNVAFSYRIVALRLGYENTRLEDETAMVAKAKENMPKPPATPAKRWTPPARPKLTGAPVIPATHAAVVPAKLGSSAN